MLDTLMRNLLSLIAVLFCHVAIAQEFIPNYDEDKIPNYILPELLITKNVEKVKSAEQWENVRRQNTQSTF